ncbi:MAG: pectinesterase family protein, partial [Bacteroides sp.]
NEANATLTFSFTGTVYVPKLIIEPVTEPVEPVYITENTSIVYGAKGGTPNVTFTGGYSTQGTALNAADSVAANGAVKWTSAKYHGTDYGIYVGNGASLEVGVTGSAKITFVTSEWNTAGKTISVTSSDATGTIDESGISECKVAADGEKLTVTYTAGNEANATLTFSFTGTVYVPALIIEPIKEEVYLAKGTTTKVIFTGTIDAGNAGNYTDDLNDLKGTYAAEVDYLGAADLKHADEAVVLSRAKYHGTGYGLYVPAGETFDINVAGSATITMVGSTWSDAGNITASSSDAAGSFDNASVSTKPETDKGNITIKYTGDSNAKLTLTFGANTYVGNIIVTVDEAKAPAVLDTSKIDVWDFGAEALDAEKYNNNLTVDVINGFYPGVAGGTAGKNIASFTAKDGAGEDAVKFNDGGYTAAHRLRTTNTSLTRYDNKSLTDAASNVYSGYIYSNKGSSADVNIMVYLYEGDILTAYLAANSGDALYKLVGPDGKDYATFEYKYESGKAQKATFYADSEGWYKLYCSNEKLVCARILREHVPTVTVSGSISVPGTIPNDYKLVFVNNTTKKVTEATVTGSNYTVDLCGKYDYTVALENANGFVVNAECNSLTLGTEAKAHNVTVQAVNLVTLTGSVTGLEDKLANMKLTFASENVYVPELNVNTADGTFTLKLEKDVTYAVTADGVNDYALNTTSISASADGTKNIEFTKKSVYPVAVHVVGVSDTTGATVTFKNINEEGYNYTFGIEENVSLRDGQYKVVIEGIATAPVVQGATSDAIVNGAATEVTIPLEEISSWDFAKLAAKTESNEVTTIGGQTYYVGLKLSGEVKEHNNVYLYANGKNADSTITVPNVKKGSIVTIKYCYCASFKAGDKVIDEKSGSTGQIDSVAVTAAEDGDFVITTTAGTNASETYFCAIEVKETGDYRSTLHVGADKEFNTINDALAAARKMTRTSDQAVTIKVDPGDYEEMLVIDIPNVRLVNASATPSIALKDKGVGIDDNAVRVTWYYGHGYTYYSMGSDCKYSMDILAANKANGYASFVNPGSGTTSGSYWNASVVVTADNFVADGIIFENSFNQYVSAKSVEDVIEAQSSAKEGSVKRAEMKTVGDTKVQEKEYVERAAALAIYNNVKEVYFNNCKFVGRQDTLYGGTGVTAAFNKCDILGGTDYIFGGMTAVFKECNLVFNTNDQTPKGEKDDVGYITAPQQSSGRGYLMYECHVTSTTPGVDTASLHTSKPGYFGRPWQANTGEAVFYNTTVDAADSFWNSGDYSFGESLIRPVAWDKTLSDISPLCGEYGTIEKSGVDNSAKRASWAQVFATPQLTDGSPISIETFLGSWNPFGLVIEDDEEITVVPNEDGAIPVEDVEVSEDTVFVDENGIVVTDGTIVIEADEIAPADKTVMETEVAAKIDTTKFDISGVSYIDINALMGGVKVNVRTGKLTITVEIPSSINYDPAKDSVKVLHKTSAGIVEHAVTKGTGKQISFEVSSLSPFAIVVYSEKTVTPPTDDNSDDDDDKQETATTAPTVPVTPVAPVVPTESATEAGTEENVGSAETGDRAPIALFMLLAVLSAGALAVTSKKRV